MVHFFFKKMWQGNQKNACVTQLYSRYGVCNFCDDGFKLGSSLERGLSGSGKKTSFS